MSTIPSADQKMVDELRGMFWKIVDHQTALKQPHQGCACDYNHLCAHHAAVHNHLQQVKRELQRTIDQLESEG